MGSPAKPMIRTSVVLPSSLGFTVSGVNVIQKVNPQWRGFEKPMETFTKMTGIDIMSEKEEYNDYHRIAQEIVAHLH